MEFVLKVLKDGLTGLHVPYANGFAIILLTVLVKAATFPLTKKQVESAMAMRSLQPLVKGIQERYTGDQYLLVVTQFLLVIVFASGCLPTLATIPVWIGLYRALSNVADEGLLSEGFFWIPSLAGPTTIAARQNGSGISWLFPFLDGHPPLGWSDTLAYLVLPVLLVVSQYISVQIMQSSQSNDPNMKSSQAITKFLPLMIGYFALSVPSGLSLYWFTNNILSTAQQVWLQKLGGANISKRAIAEAEDILKEDQLQTQKSVPSLNSTRKEDRKEEKLTSEGLLPGERFKQLKEQEARRKRQKEEEMRRAEKTAARGTQLNNEGHERESNVAHNNGNVQSATKFHNDSNLGVVNGDLSGQDSEEDQKMPSMFRAENDKVSANSNVDGSDEQQSYEKVEKVL
ncbi:ALBINO3-like protein 1, chloroplastic [Morella rubra]|uniref:ALBINO3-like protein 1, chloroplastic n=1 Tax=Morella rubra TaxID=262757 RepID=A0A6A1UU29_9ROSI|nr:ALBINO3-like protein 1, chloroplastic [Morella rubra]